MSPSPPGNVCSHIVVDNCLCFPFWLTPAEPIRGPHFKHALWVGVNLRFGALWALGLGQLTYPRLDSENTDA